MTSLEVEAKELVGGIFIQLEDEKEEFMDSSESLGKEFINQRKKRIVMENKVDDESELGYSIPSCMQYNELNFFKFFLYNVHNFFHITRTNFLHFNFLGNLYRITLY